jgi:hypothetical protein
MSTSSMRTQAGRGLEPLEPELAAEGLTAERLGVWLHSHSHLINSKGGCKTTDSVRNVASSLFVLHILIQVF